MSKKKMKIRLSISFVTIALVVLSILTEGTTISATITGLAMFSLVIAAGLNIVDGNILIAVVEMVLILIYVAIFIFLEV